jgi:hypothetical protein
MQLHFDNGSQAPLRDQPGPLAAGVLANIALYAAVALVVTWLFFPPSRSDADAETNQRNDE